MAALGSLLSGYASSLSSFGGSQLQDQVAGETDEERKRRLRLQQMQTGTGSALGALGGTSLGGMYGR